ncbi:diacylglycerol O-acyltransferase 3, cytosolic [Tanacetum coccineum]
MEAKRIKKEEKAKKKADKMMMKCKDSSSSESPSSSESDCDNVMNMKEMKTKKTSNTEEGSKKIEVCMRGKCKKSGAAMLMENFQTAVGWKITWKGQDRAFLTSSTKSFSQESAKSYQAFGHLDTLQSRAKHSSERH